MFNYNNFQKVIGTILVLLLLLISIITGCKPAKQVETGNVLTYAINTDITSLDPVRLTEDNPRLISAQIMETLVDYDEKLQLQPLLAESWESSNDGNEWRFKLRPNVSFHNDPCFKGKPRNVTAEDVVYSLTRMLDPKTQTLGAFILTDVVEGAKDFMAGRTRTVAGIVAEDSQTVLFRLTKPYTQFPSRLSLQFAAVIPKEAVEYYGNQWGRHPVGTGPFIFKSWDVTTGQISLERNPDYWHKISTNLTGVNFVIAKSEATQLANFSQGKIDILEVSPAIFNEIFDKNGNPSGRFLDVQVIRTPILKVYFIGFNYRNEVLRDHNFRLACNYAVDKEVLTKSVLNGLAIPSNGPLAPSLPGTDDTLLYPQDIQKAKDLLKQSSYKGQELVYVTDNSARSVTVAEFLQSQLSAIGVKIRIDKNPESVWVDKLVKGSFDLGKLYFAFDYPSPDNGLAQFLKANFMPDGPNFLHYHNPEFDRLYDEALRESDPSKSAEIFRQLNQIVRDDTPWIFLYYPTRTIIMREGVEGLKINSLSFSLILGDVKKTAR